MEHDAPSALSANPRRTRNGFEERNELTPQKIAMIVGWLFIATFVTAIAAKVLFVSGVGGSFSQLGFTPGAINETSVYAGVILEFLLIVTSLVSSHPSNAWNLHLVDFGSAATAGQPSPPAVRPVGRPGSCTCTEQDGMPRLLCR